MKKIIYRNVKEKFLISEEVHQALIRLILVLIIVAYIAGYELLFRGHQNIVNSFFLAALIIISIVEIPISYLCSQLKESNRFRKLFRILTNIIDNFFLSLAIVIIGNAGLILFPVYLWITFGIGIRYGVKYLMLSAALNIICFSSVIYMSPIWHDEKTIMLSYGLLLALVILPSYVYILIKKLSVALDISKKSVKIKESFLANINHELRTPLTSIINLTELMHDSDLQDKHLQMIDMINTSANIQLKIINSVLDISKIEAGAYELNYKVFSIYSLLYEVRQIIFPLTIKKDVNLYIYIDSKIHRNHNGAHEQIKQILINIAGNAVKFTEHGKISISAHSLSNNNKSERLIFRVEDTGIGIDKIHHQEIFKPFNQADISISSKYGGTGLGISISNELSKLMNGTLSIESEINKGTVFTFDINLEIANSDDQNDLSDIIIIPFKLSKSETKITDYYSQNHGINILNNIDQRLQNLDSEIRKLNSIVIYNDDVINKLSIDEKNYLNKNIIVKICIANDKSYNKDIVPITSINHDASSNILDNALSIAAVFMSKKKNHQFINLQRPGQLRILVAEDDPTQSIINKIVFTRYNCNLITVQDGLSALMELITNKYDIAVLDLHMPKMSGLEVAREFKLLSPTPKTSLILLTADTMPNPKIEQYSSLFLEIIHKPISLTKIIDSILNITHEDVGYDSNEYIISGKKYTIKDDEKIISRQSALESGSDLINNISSFASLADLLNLVDIYNHEIDAQIDKLFDSAASGNYLDVKNILHRMKGASSSIGAIKFSEYISGYVDIETNESEVYLSLNKQALRTVHAESVSLLRNEIAMLNT